MESAVAAGHSAVTIRSSFQHATWTFVSVTFAPFHLAVEWGLLLHTLVAHSAPAERTSVGRKYSFPGTFADGCKIVTGYGN